MKKKIAHGRIAQNVSWIVACRIVQALLSMAIAMLSARYLGPSNYGLVNYAASITTFFAPIVYLGLNSTLVRELIASPKEEGRIIGTAIVMSVISAFACMLGIILFVSVANSGERETLLVCALYSTLLLFQAIDLIQYWFLSKYLSKISSIVMLVSYAVMSLYKLFLLATRKRVEWFAISNSIEYMLIAILLIIMYRLKGGEPFSFSWELGKRMFAKSKYYILSSLMVTVSLHIGKILINTLLNDVATGYYSAATAVMLMPSFAFTAIVDSFRPEVLKCETEERIEASMAKLYAVVFYLALAQCIGITLLARPIIMIIYGTEYINSVDVLKIGIWHTLISYIAYARGVWVLASNNQKYLWIINLVGALTSIVVNCVLIPRIGILGTAVASIATEVMSNIVVCCFIKPLRKGNVLILKAINPFRIHLFVRKICRE